MRLFLFGFFFIFAADTFKYLINMKSLRVFRPILSAFIIWMAAVSVRAGDVAPASRGAAFDVSFYCKTMSIDKVKPVGVKWVCNSAVSAGWKK